ncbi:MAG: TRM11 family methyltransferase [Planctomycetota bacterium]
MHLWRFDWDHRTLALAQAEARALAVGRLFAPGLYLGELPFEPGRAAFGAGGGEVIARGAPEDLVLPEPGLRAHVVRGPWKVSGNPVDLLARIPGAPRIAPRACGIEVLCAEPEWLVVRAPGAPPAFSAPTLPHRSSTSTSSQLARAVVNLVARPGQRVLDPLCGTGVLLVEAARLGCVVSGSDRNPRGVVQARANLAALELPGEVRIVDALELAPSGADALVADLPYGRRLAPAALEPLLWVLPTLAPRWALISHLDLSEALAACGHEAREVIEVPKTTFVRRVFVGGPPP